LDLRTSASVTFIFALVTRHGILPWLATTMLLLPLLESILLVASLFTLGYSYPVIIQVDDSSKRCFRFNVPEDDE
jgi:hypothetical protein